MLTKPDGHLYTLIPVPEGFLLRRVTTLPSATHDDSTANPDAWLEKSIIKHCTGRRLSASQYRSQYLTRSKHSTYSTEYIAGCMAFLAASGVLKAMPSEALNARGGIYYSTVIQAHNLPPCTQGGLAEISLEAEIAPPFTETPLRDCDPG